MPVQQLRARNRQQKILRAAATVISRRGYRDAAVEEIAREAQTSKGGVYFHFPGKEAILLALLDHTAALLRGKVETAIAAEPDPVAKADAALRTLLRILAKHRTLARVFAVEAGAAGPRFNARVLAIQDEFIALIREQLDDAVSRRRDRAGRYDRRRAGLDGRTRRRAAALREHWAARRRTPHPRSDPRHLAPHAVAQHWRPAPPPRRRARAPAGQRWRQA